MAAFALAMAWPALAHAQAQGDVAGVTLRTSNYVDDDDTVINTNALAARLVPVENLTVNGRLLVDVTSSASVDVVSAATGRWEEARVEGLGGVTYADGSNTVSASYILSNERDWTSHNVSVGGSRDFMNHNLTLGLGASYVDNAVGRADDDNFARAMQVYGATVSAVVVGDPENIFSASYTLAYNSGYQASPYRFAYLRDADTGLVRGVEEAHPEVRMRHALTLLWNRHVFADSALRTHVRGYVDDWGVASLTTGTELLVGVGHYELGAHVRGYAQRHAAFYRDVYDQPRLYMTADRELSTFYDVFAGASLGWRAEAWRFDQLGLDLKLTGFGFYFPEFQRLPRRLGLVAELGVRAIW